MKAPLLIFGVLCTTLSAGHAFQVTLRGPGARLAASSFAAVRQCATPALGMPLARRRDVLTLRMNQQQDELIRKLADVDPLYLPSAASQSIKEVSTPAFFMRIATLSDESKNEQEKSKLAALASNLVVALEVVVQRTEERMDDSADVVQQVLAAAAEANGEFALPLKPERIQSMRAALVQRRQLVDEAVLSCLFAYMKKASEDQLDGMVSIFQTMLQEWAAIELLEAKPNNVVLEEMLAVNSDKWDDVLNKAKGKEGALDADALLSAVQSCVEKVVLQKASGSYSQRVQAEFLREIMARIRAVSQPA